MIALTTASEVAFWIMAPVMVILAVGLVTMRKPVHSALCMVGIMISLGILYASLDAPFLFVVQIIVYTGAIMMLFLFVVMLVGVGSSDSIIETIRGQRVLAVLAAGALAALLVFTIGGSVTKPDVGLETANSGPGGNPGGLATLIFGDYVIVFQSVAALLVIATVGAMVLAHRERLKPKMTQKDMMVARMKAYAETGQHPGGLPNPGVFARHNGIDAPAMLPDGTVSDLSISETLRARGVILDGEQLAEATPRTYRAITSAEDDE